MEYLLIGLNLEPILLYESAKGNQCNITHPSDHGANVSRIQITVNILNFITNISNLPENKDLLETYTEMFKIVDMFLHVSCGSALV